jgi:dolichol-phosphate mannosyltransferase
MTVTVVIPALNEEGNVGRLIHETFRVVPREISEVIIVDDGSSDNTGDEIKSLISIYPRLRYIRHGVRTGQSAAIRTGILAARNPIIATMDGDGQNDPADIPGLLRRLGVPGRAGPALVAGIRARRHTKTSRRIASALANITRQAVLKDGCPDSGCGIKVFRRETFLRLPFFTSMHRFSPALFLIYGQKVEFVPVNDRPRVAGKSKYTNLSRFFLGLYDMIGVVWLRRRTRLPAITEDTLGVTRLRDVALGPVIPVASRHFAELGQCERG